MSGDVQDNAAGNYSYENLMMAPNEIIDETGKIKKARGRRVASVNDIGTVQRIDTSISLKCLTQ
jgi:hypothetical protein